MLLRIGGATPGGCGDRRQTSLFALNELVQGDWAIGNLIFRGAAISASVIKFYQSC
jgi:hypothetical protein